MKDFFYNVNREPKEHKCTGQIGGMVIYFPYSMLQVQRFAHILHFLYIVNSAAQQNLKVERQGPTPRIVVIWGKEYLFLRCSPKSGCDLYHKGKTAQVTHKTHSLVHALQSAMEWALV